MSPDPARVRWCALVGVALLLAASAAGCGGARYPVEGRVLLKGVPLKGKEGAVVLKPDTSKGNQSSESAAGTLQPDGSYSINPGARPGWYKVVVLATVPGANPNEDFRRVINARYEKESTTPLAIEVVPDPSPGRYDLSLSP